MLSTSYLIAVNASSNEIEIMLTIYNIAGKGTAVCSQSDGTGTATLWMIPKGKKSRQEVLVQLKAVPSIVSLEVVALSNPVKDLELTNARAAMAHIALDASEVTNAELLQFINDKLNGQYNYYIDLTGVRKASHPFKVRIKPLKELPGYSRDMTSVSSNAQEEDPDKVYTIEDIKSTHVFIEDFTDDDIE
jgi:hypothetical protein